MGHSGGISVHSLIHPFPISCSALGSLSPAHPPVSPAPAHTQFPAVNPLIRTQNPHGELQLLSLIICNGSFSLAQIPKEGRKPLQDCLWLHVQLGQASRLSSQINYGNKTRLSHKTPEMRVEVPAVSETLHLTRGRANPPALTSWMMNWRLFTPHLSSHSLI